MWYNTKHGPVVDLYFGPFPGIARLGNNFSIMNNNFSIMKKSVTFVRVPALAVALLCAGSVVAGAQISEEVPLGETVLSRARPELEPLGIGMSSFLLFPKLIVEESYNDNIFSVEDGKSADFITVVNPALVLRSDWNNHALNFGVDASIVRNADFNKEDYEDYHARIDGQFDITRNSYFSASLDTSILHEGRGSPDDVDGTEPTKYMLNSGSAQFFQRLNRLSFTVDGSQQYYNFDDSPTDGTPINNDDRDRVESDLSLRVGYEIVPEYEAFAVLKGNLNDYDAAVDDNGDNRDSRGFEFDIGTRIDLGGIISGDIFIGYRLQDFDDRTFKTIKGMTFGTGLVWNLTPLTTLNGNIVRVIEETTSANTSGFIATSLTISADHELLRNLLLNGSLGASLNDYKGIDREGHDLSGGIRCEVHA